MTNEITAQQTPQQGEIILYQPDETVRLEVRLEDETVWLTANQMAALFDREDSNIRRHIINVFKEGELERENNVHFLHVNGVKKPVPFYTLDVIISVGYRVKSKRGTEFRQWANKVIKDYLIRGYAINQRLLQMEQRIDARLDAHIETEQKHFSQIESTLADHQEKIDFFVRTNQPPVEGIFYDGQIFDAYRFVSDFGASLKDLGRKWFAFTLMHDLTAEELITRISSTQVNIEN